MADAELLNWASSHRISDSPPPLSPSFGYTLTISTFPLSGGRGLAAARDLKEGELILIVPEHALLSVASANEDARFMEALHHHPNLSSVEMLTSLLLREIAKGSSSRWFPYLKFLPKSYSTMMHFSTLERSALQVKDAIWIAERAVEKAKMEWKVTKPFLENLGLTEHFLTLKAWLWASSTVSSRTLHVPWSTAGTLCPIGDLFNYATPGCLLEDMVDSFSCNLSELHTENEPRSIEVRDGIRFDEGNYGTGSVLHFSDRLTDGGYDADAKAYCFYAREDYKKGDQVLLCYGTYTNLELLEHYGFILTHNPNDKIAINPFTMKGLISELPSLPNFPDGSMHIEADGRPSFLLFAALRLCCASTEVRKHKGHLALCGQQLSVENDIKAYEILKQESNRLLECCATTINMDAALLHILSLCGSIEGLSGLLELIDHEETRHEAGTRLLLDCVCGWATLSAIDQQQVLQEVASFIEFSEKRRKVTSSQRDDLPLQRWWISIMWRFCYKRILYRCISICNGQACFLTAIR